MAKGVQDRGKKGKVVDQLFKLMKKSRWYNKEEVNKLFDNTRPATVDNVLRDFIFEDKIELNKKEEKRLFKVK